MCEIHSSNTRGRHFMSLVDGFPIPKQKTGSLIDLLGINFYPRSSIDQVYSVLGQNIEKYEEESVVHGEGVVFDKDRTVSLVKQPLMDEIVIEPHNIGLIPASEWAPQALSLQKIRESYFVRKNGAARQFDIKLYNALCITWAIPASFSYIGVKWVDLCTFKVNSKVFCNFLKIKGDNEATPIRILELSKYGFERVYKSRDPRLVSNPECDDVDEDIIRLYTDPMRRFSRDKRYSLADISYTNSTTRVSNK